jgi:ABC-type sugar transport system permease subunit
MGNIIKWVFAALCALATLLAVYSCYINAQPIIGVTIFAMGAIGLFVYLNTKAYAYRYMFPGLAAIAVFVVLPLIFTFYLGFTNYGSKNLKSFDRVKHEDFLSEKYRLAGNDYNAVIVQDGASYRLVFAKVPVAQASAGENENELQDLMTQADGLSAPVEEKKDAALDPDAALQSTVDKANINLFVTPDSLGLANFPANIHEMPVTLKPLADVKVAISQDLLDYVQCDAADIGGAAHFVRPDLCDDRTKMERIQDEQSKLQTLLTSGLEKLVLTIPEEEKAIVKDSLNYTFGPYAAKYSEKSVDQLLDNETSTVLTANYKTGFFETASGEQVKTGFKTTIGFANYIDVFTSKKYRGPFLQIFIWTVVFSLLTVITTLSLGCLLAVVINWEGLKFRGVYRALLFLPYAVPGFISILVFKGMFRPSGEINMVLSSLFNLKEAINWTGDPWLAKSMLLLVNTWLGYPYMMVLCMGLIKAIPADLYEASAIAGAGPLTNFFKITVPLIVKPITPLLVASFAFNFNNFVLVQLLTAGRPDFLNAETNAGQTDILVSYTYKLAFEGGQQYGLAAAISTVIFILVVVMSLFNMRLAKINNDDNGEAH